jgi:hypothetical protein
MFKEYLWNWLLLHLVQVFTKLGLKSHEKMFILLWDLLNIIMMI